MRGNVSAFLIKKIANCVTQLVHSNHVSQIGYLGCMFCSTALTDKAYNIWIKIINQLFYLPFVEFYEQTFGQVTGDKIHSVSYINDPVCSLKIVSYAGIVTYLRSNCNTHDLTSFFQFIYFGIDNSTIYTNCIQVFSIWVVALLIISLLYSRKAFPPIVPPSYSDARLFQRTVLRATFSIYVSSENPEDDEPPLTVSFP